jgi:hypothetical protein
MSTGDQRSSPTWNVKGVVYVSGHYARHGLCRLALKKVMLSFTQQQLLKIAQTVFPNSN